MTGTDLQILGKLVKRMKNGEKDPLRPLIDAYYMRRERAPERLDEVTLQIRPRPRPGGRLSPSSLGGCQRAAVFQFTGTKGHKHIDPDSEAIFEDGIWRHHRWQSLFMDMERVLGRKTFRVIEIEKSVTIPDIYVAGSLDVTVYIKGYGRIVIDIKGINDAGFSRIVTTDAPLPKHVKQLITYEKARRVHKGLLLYENKNNQQLRNFLVHWDDEKWEAVQQWAEYVIDSLRRHKLPAKDLECQSGNFLYERCPFSHLCYGRLEHDELIELAYSTFVGVDRAWQRGHKIAQTEELI